jgi:4-hydroxybenzoate polyprenyltransferase
VEPTLQSAPVTDSASVPGALPPLPICVDLDGSLVKSDTLVDSILLLVRRHPLRAFQLPLWLLKGKAGFKAEIGRNVTLDVERLPYNQPLLESLRQRALSGRYIYLATGADQALANRVSDHLGLFVGTFASDGTTNLTGSRKLAALREKFGDRFLYIGNSSADMPLLRAAAAAELANPHSGIAGRLRSQGKAPENIFLDRAPRFSALRRAIRVPQWAKNILLFVPLLLAHVPLKSHRIRPTLLAFAVFCLTASATYIVNDLLDIEADRHHARKRRRPFAAGDVAASSGILIVLALLALAVAGLFFLPLTFAFWLTVYFVTTLAYSFFLKRVPLVDVIVLAALYTVRIVAGGAASQVEISPWLGGFSLFFFLSLAIVKRYSELHNLQVRGLTPANQRGYLVGDLDQLRSFGTASGYAAVVVFTLYINSPAVVGLYTHPQRLWLLAPLLIFWISRVWLLAARGQLDDDPVIFAITDRVSLLLGLLTVAVLFGSAL